MATPQSNKDEPKKNKLKHVIPDMAKENQTAMAGRAVQTSFAKVNKLMQLSVNLVQTMQPSLSETEHAFDHSKTCSVLHV